MRRVSVVILIVVMALLTVVGGAGYLVLSERAQRWVCAEGMEMLREKLGTRVEMDSVEVSLLRGEASLYGFRMEDRQGVEMLKVRRLSVDVKMLELLRKRLAVQALALDGAEMVLYKERKDSAGNWEFLREALTTKTKTKTKTETETETETKTKAALDIELRALSVEDVRVCWDVRDVMAKGGDTLDVNHLRLRDMTLTAKGTLTGSGRLLDVSVGHLQAKEEKSGMELNVREASLRSIKDRSMALLMKEALLTHRDRSIGCDVLSVTQTGGVPGEGMTVKMDSMRYSCSHSKRKWNPKKGRFDAKHLDIVADVEAVTQSLKKDSVAFVIKRLAGVERHSGLVVKDMTATVLYKDNALCVSDVSIAMPRTTVNVEKTTIRINKDEATRKSSVMVEPTRVTATVGLQDLAEPFAPALSNFTTPLALKVDVTGDLDRLLLRDIYITSPRQRLRLSAQGDICDMRHKERLVLHFNDIYLDARSGVKEQIVGHFAKKMNLKMMRQMEAIGDVSFRGQLTIPYRRELIKGTLFTGYGNVAMDFALEGTTKRMHGTMSSDRIEMGEIMNVSGLGPMSASATYDFCIAARKPAKKNEEVGKLPEGWLKANVREVTFKKMTFRNITTEMVSNGTTAEGTVGGTLKMLDVSARFSYTQTTKRQSWMVHPKVRLSKKTEEERAAKAAEKARRKAEKEQRKAEMREKTNALKERFSRLFKRKSEE